MPNLKIAFVMTTVAALSMAAPGDTQLLIKKFRFNHHKQLHFERLVLEFAKSGTSRATPQVSLTPSNSGKETVVSIQRATLVGAIPEASINDSYTRKSVYLGPISLNTDAASGFNIRTFMKQSHSSVDAFWLENPTRLIVDVFPKGSERASGPHVISRHVASENSFVERSQKHSSHHASANSPKQDLVLCFPNSSQVKANIGFQRQPNRLGLGLTVTIDSTFSLAALPTSDGIVCYPRGAQVVPTLNFAPKDAPFHGRVDLDRPERIADNRQNYAPQLPLFPENQYTGPSMGVSPNDAATNADADLALSLPDEGDAGRRLPSGEPSNYSDNFNKNNPPATLGKQLPEPGSPEAQSLQLASPAGLLPPLAPPQH